MAATHTFDYDVDPTRVEQYLALATRIWRGDFVAGQAMIPDGYMQFLVKHQHDHDLKYHLPVPPGVATVTITDSLGRPTIVLAPDSFSAQASVLAANPAPSYPSYPNNSTYYHSGNHYVGSGPYHPPSSASPAQDASAGIVNAFTEQFRAETYSLVTVVEADLPMVMTMGLMVACMVGAEVVWIVVACGGVVMDAGEEHFPPVLGCLVESGGNLGTRISASTSHVDVSSRVTASSSSSPVVESLEICDVNGKRLPTPDAGLKRRMNGLSLGDSPHEAPGLHLALSNLPSSSSGSSVAGSTLSSMPSLSNHIPPPSVASTPVERAPVQDEDTEMGDRDAEGEPDDSADTIHRLDFLHKSRRAYVERKCPFPIPVCWESVGAGGHGRWDGQAAGRLNCDNLGFWGSTGCPEASEREAVAELTSIHGTPSLEEGREDEGRAPGRREVAASS
ncbi:hypothetical protein AGABI1DRAFT_109625 [Agaricus bisporus var. burnettii JB137-S8]|uniref:Uncharacterized protein n=1 Tax=Agaricus bisporus var. burnettii (strain JB137-S8 / ATCC MYA-4627 / FGSC 10392) TaxID=597362 RepID=K5WIT7_AGABU|nr:uncharacterized protein AGABI1DRAFT_109625 [Agaricus bisporus var. burnettii JB137-S8]EKM75181.1 hypothetical protein AGABI1DRAFT_109625 [Agaricus bisporus var. burnettii JB137-S8]